MAWSRSARIKTLLAIDTVFLFIELITGYTVGSLALVADSFHMLNDVMSLIVALYALKLAENSTRSNKYSYGWQRAEILGALVNGVFLLALCFSIFLEAIQRMFGRPEVSSPHIVVFVGSLGLLSNMVGLVLFHEHGHGHSHGHSHSHDSKAEQGHSHAVTTFSSSAKKLKNGKARANGGIANGDGQTNERSPLLLNSSGNVKDFPALPTQQASQNVAIGGAETPFSMASTYEDDDNAETEALDELLVHPARTREAIVRQAYDAGFGSPRNTNEGGFGSRRRASSFQSSMARIGRPKAEGATIKSRERSASRGSAYNHEGNGAEHEHAHDDEHEHEHDEHDDEEGHEHEHDHDHDDEDDGHGHGHGGHSHGNMNMHGVFLHVLGDALGNVGVIAAGLIIWLTKSPYRFYSDPVISFIITIIIFSSALPLVRSASFILLQGTPAHVPLEKVRHAILKIPNVISVHDLHIWSLSESKLVASMHILVKSHEEFATCSQNVRKVLHRFGVHSTTIQPEVLDMANPTTQNAVGIIMSRQGSSELLGQVDEDDGVGCMAQCVEDACIDNSCCPPNTLPSTLPSKSVPSPVRTAGPSGGPSYAAVASGN